MSIKFLVLGGGYLGFFWGGGSADFIFMGARIFLNLVVEVFQERAFQGMLAASYVVLEACVSVLRRFRQGWRISAFGFKVEDVVTITSCGSYGHQLRVEDLVTNFPIIVVIKSAKY